MDHETRQRSQHQFPVVGIHARAALGMGHRHHAVDVRVPVRLVLQQRFQAPHETRRLRRDAQQDDVVPGPDAPRRAAVETVEHWRTVAERYLLTRCEGGFIQFVGHHAVFEIGLVREVEIDLADAERVEDIRVAQVVAGRDVPGRPTEGQAPGQDELPGGYGPDGEAVAFQQGMGEGEGRAGVADHVCTGFQPPGDDGRVVAGFGQARDIFQPAGGHDARVLIE